MVDDPRTSTGVDPEPIEPDEENDMTDEVRIPGPGPRDESSIPTTPSPKTGKPLAPGEVEPEGDSDAEAQEAEEQAEETDEDEEPTPA